MSIKCLVVDDEPLAIEIIESYISRLDNMEIVATCSNALQAFELVQKHPIDLIFLDIQMPKLTGLDFLKTLKNPPKVILTTAYREYAIESYELDVLDYLLKPISFDRFLKAIGKVYNQQPTESTPKISTSVTDNEASIFLKADKKMVKVLLNEILYIEGLKDYVRVKTVSKEIISLQKMGYLEEILPEDKFLRIHRSYIVSLNKIECYTANSLEVGNQEIPIGPMYKNAILKRLDGQQI